MSEQLVNQPFFAVSIL